MKLFVGISAERTSILAGSMEEARRLLRDDP